MSCFFTASEPARFTITGAPTSSGSASNRYGSGKPKVLDEKYLLHSYIAAGDPCSFRGANARAADSKPAPAPAPRKLDRAAAYYHYTVAHMYEEQVAVYGRSELANKAIEEYRLAIDADPTSEYLTSALAELYAKTGRIRDAVVEAQDILKRDPNNLEAHKLLGRIYLRSLGDMQAGNGSQNVLKLAIEQYEQIIRLEPDNVTITCCWAASTG